MEVLFLSPTSHWASLHSSLLVRQVSDLDWIQYTQLSAAPGMEAVIHIGDGWHAYEVED